jgi:hypothetical protein
MGRIALLAAALLASSALYAAPVGNTSAPELIREGFFISCDSWIDFRVGYEGDFVTDGRMGQYDQGAGRLDTYEQWTNSGTVTLNVLDRLDLYGVFGSSRTEADWRFNNDSNGSISRIKLETKYNFLWGVGARTILHKWRNTYFGLGGRYSFCSYIPMWMTSDGIIQPVSNSHFDWREWQINLDISYKIDLFTPYIGVKYSNARAYLKSFAVPISSSLTGENSFENRIPVGLYLGCGLSTGRYFMLNIEARVVDEEAATVSCDFRF